MTYKTQHDYVSTYTGKKFHFLNPQPDEIDLEDIIHALSLICRYNGAVKHHYSVLSHSINVCTYVYEKTNCHKQALAALCHDFSEAYITDIPRPIKPYLSNYMDIEANITKAINDKFGIPEMTDFIHYVDKNIVRAEAEALFLHTPEWVNEYDVLTSKQFMFNEVSAEFEKSLAKELFEHITNAIALEGK